MTTINVLTVESNGGTFSKVLDVRTGVAESRDGWANLRDFVSSLNLPMLEDFRDWFPQTWGAGGHIILLFSNAQTCTLKPANSNLQTQTSFPSMQIALQLLISFLLIGLGAYGGGLVTIPLIQHEIVVNQQWLSFDDMASLLAVAQMTPGPIAVNAATFVGFRVNGVIGSAIATFAVILPAILILLWLAPFVDRISHNLYVLKIRRGIQLGVLSLILYATWSYGSGVIASWRDLLIGLAAFAVLVIFEGKLHPIFVILACGGLGLVIF